jgi:hypothetical protein
MPAKKAIRRVGGSIWRGTPPTRRVYRGGPRPRKTHPFDFTLKKSCRWHGKVSVWCGSTALAAALPPFDFTLKESCRWHGEVSVWCGSTALAAALPLLDYSRP